MSRICASLLAVFLFLALSASAWAQEKVCPKCNKAYPADAKFCLDDGASLVAVEKCPKCRAVRTGKARYCPSCGYDFEKPAALLCAKCGKTSPPGTRYCTNCGAPMNAGGGAEPVPSGGTGGGGPEVRQWVDSVVAASSQYAVKLFARDQIVGPPNVERPGQDGKAWSPSMAKRGVEWITLQFAKPVVPSMIRIYETASQGFVSRVDVVVDGREISVWEGSDSTTPANPVFEVIPRSAPPRTNTVKITVDTSRTRGWTEIDAVELVAGGAAGGGTTGGHDGEAHAGGIGDGPLGVRVGSSLRYQVTRGGRNETLQIDVHLLSDKSIGLAWTATGDRSSAGYAQVRQANLADGAAYDDLFPDEQAETLEEATTVWIPRRLYQQILEGGRCRLDVAGVGRVSLNGANHITQNVTVDGVPKRMQVLSALIQGGGKLAVLDDAGNPLVLEMERNGFHMTLLEATEVGGHAGVANTGTGKPPIPGGTSDPKTTGGTPDPDAGLPVFATPDACFDAWKAAVLAADAAKLAQCYVSAERSAMERDAETASGVFDRYKESLEKSKFSIESKKEAGSQTVWVMEIRVREVFWTRKAKETLKFSKEGASYRLQIEKDGF